MQDSEYSVPLAISGDPEQWYQPDPYFAGWPYIESFSDLFGMLSEAVGSIVDMYEDAFKSFTATYEHLKPWMEIQLGHAAVCTHKVKCKPPGPGAVFNEPSLKRRRR